MSPENPWAGQPDAEHNIPVRQEVGFVEISSKRRRNSERIELADTCRCFVAFWAPSIHRSAGCHSRSVVQSYIEDTLAILEIRQRNLWTSFVMPTLAA